MKSLMKGLMKKTLAAWAAAILALSSTGPLAAHHSLANFDTETPVWVKGRVVLFQRVNPHSVIFVDEVREDGQVRRWAVDGPGLPQLVRMGFGTDFVKPGDVIEVCGFATKKGAGSQRPFPEPVSVSLRSSTPEPSGQLLNGNLLVMPDGRKRVLSNYGQLYQCLGPEDQYLLDR